MRSMELPPIFDPKRATERIEARDLFTSEELKQFGTSQQRDAKLEHLGHRGDVKAMLTLATLRMLTGGQSGQAEAVALLEKASAAGNARGLFFLGHAYLEGNGVSVDKPRAFRYFLDAAKKGDPWAHYWVRQCYEHGIGTDVNRSHLASCGRAARAGYGHAQARLGVLNHQAGRLENALHWFTIAAEQGEVGAFSPLASILLYEGGPISRQREGLMWLEKAHAHTNAWASLRLGEVYLNGDFAVQRDADKDFEALRQAHECGEPTGTALLAYCFDQGIGTKRNEQEAARLYRISADANNHTGRIGLAVLHLEGRGVPQDAPKAGGLLQGPANAGDPLAQYNLALVYLHLKDLDSARTYFQKAANQNFEPARQRLKMLGMQAPAEMYKQAFQEAYQMYSKYLSNSYFKTNSAFPGPARSPKRAP